MAIVTESPPAVKAPTCDEDEVNAALVRLGVRVSDEEVAAALKRINAPRCPHCTSVLSFPFGQAEGERDGFCDQHGWLYHPEKDMDEQRYVEELRVSIRVLLYIVESHVPPSHQGVYRSEMEEAQALLARAPNVNPDLADMDLEQHTIDRLMKFARSRWAALMAAEADRPLTKQEHDEAADLGPLIDALDWEERHPTVVNPDLASLTCPRCEGGGKYQRLPSSPVTECAVCNGTGQVSDLVDVVDPDEFPAE